MSILGNPITLGGGGADLNIDFGSTPPADTSKLWVPLSTKPSKIKADTVLDYGDNMHEEITMVNGVTSTQAPQSSVLATKNGLLSSGYFVDGKYIYCIGKRNNYLLRYNMETNTMEYVGRSPIAVEYSSVAISNGFAYINGGINVSDNIWYNGAVRIDLTSGTGVQLGTSSKLARGTIGWMQSVIVDNKIYQFGGGYSASNGSGNYNTVWIYDIVQDSYTYGATLPKRSNSMSAVPVGNTVYLFGGRKSVDGGDVGAITNEIAKYSIIDNTTTVLQTVLPKPGKCMSACLFAGKIYIVSSHPDSAYEKYNYLCIFDPATETIQNVGQITNKEYYGMGACGAYGTSIFFISNSTTDASVLKVTPKTILDKDVLFIQEAFIPKNKIALVKSKDAEVMCDVESVWLGNDANYADRQSAYIYNNATSQWELVDGTSVTADALNALNIMGVN
jgi:hypothetical protein|nr:MAG TPA: Kelch repeat [Caudoviricetes sp.]